MLIYITRKSLSRTASITQSPVITLNMVAHQRIELCLNGYEPITSTNMLMRHILICLGYVSRRYVAARCQCLATYGSPPVGRVPSNVISGTELPIYSCFRLVVVGYGIEPSINCQANHHASLHLPPLFCVSAYAFITL